MADQNATPIRQIQIGENNHEINARYWNNVETLKTIGGESILGSGNIGLNVFVGTMSEYEASINNIAFGALVIILDDSLGGGDNNGGSGGVLPETSELSSILGKAILGKMKLGQI